MRENLVSLVKIVNFVKMAKLVPEAGKVRRIVSSLGFVRTGVVTAEEELALFYVLLGNGTGFG